MGRSPSRSRSSRHKSSSSSSYKRSYRDRDRDRSRSPRESKSYRDSRRSRNRSRSRSLSRYGSSRSGGRSKYESSSRRRHRSSSSSSSGSSYSSHSSRSRRSSPERKLPKKVDKPAPPAVVQPEPTPVVFDSVNFLHDKDKKPALEDLDNEGFVQKSFQSNKKPEEATTPMDTDVQAVSAQTPKPPPEDDVLMHHSLFMDEEGRLDKWVRKLHNFRQKMAQEMA